MNKIDVFRKNFTRKVFKNAKPFLKLSIINLGIILEINCENTKLNDRQFQKQFNVFEHFPGEIKKKS
jgi:hypothetical protein